MKTLFPLPSVLLTTFCLNSAAVLSAAQADDFHIFGKEKNIELIRALLISKVPMKIKAGVRSVTLKKLSFRFSNGHNCDNVENSFCGMQDPPGLNNIDLPEYNQLSTAIEHVVDPVIKKAGKISGDCAAGSCFESYDEIHCTWKVIESRKSPAHTGYDVENPKCTVSGEFYHDQS
jgi:hypothetical protein